MSQIPFSLLTRRRREFTVLPLLARSCLEAVRTWSETLSQACLRRCWPCRSSFHRFDAGAPLHTCDDRLLSTGLPWIGRYRTNLPTSCLRVIRPRSKSGKGDEPLPFQRTPGRKKGFRALVTDAPNPGPPFLRWSTANRLRCQTGFEAFCGICAIRAVARPWGSRSKLAMPG